MKKRLIEILGFTGRLILTLIYGCLMITVIIPVLIYIFTGHNPYDILEKVVPKTQWEKDMEEMYSEYKEGIIKLNEEIKSDFEKLNKKS